MPARKKPIEQHQLQGTYRADRHGPLAADDRPADELPPKPAGLTPEEAAVWDRLAPLLLGTVKVRDVPAFEELCGVKVMCERFRRAVLDLPTNAATKTLVSYGIALDKLIKLSERFGLTPADRAKLRTHDPAPAAPKVRVRQPTAFDRQNGTK